MRIGIDITSLIYQRGVSRYTRNLIYALLDKQIDLSLYGYSWQQYRWLKAEAEALVAQQPNAEVAVQRIPPKLLEVLWKLNLKTVATTLPNLDVFHSWDWIQPPDTTIPLVSTIHDLAMLKFPEAAHPSILKHHQKSWQVLKDREAHLSAISRSTKQDIVELLGYPSYLVHVIYEALPLEVHAVSQTLSEERYDQLLSELNLQKPFIFFVGTREPRKNLDRLIQAWEPLQNDFELIIAGETGWDKTSNSHHYQALQEKGLRFLGRVTDEALSVLYAEAAVFAFPSLYEGFGLPILEAFHHGTPVVTANNSGMLEVAGNAAELVNAESVESIRQGLTTVLSETLPEQKKRLQRMIIRQQMFSWEQVATQTLKVYKQAVEDFKS